MHLELRRGHQVGVIPFTRLRAQSDIKRRSVATDAMSLWRKTVCGLSGPPEVRRFVDNLGVGLCQKGSKDQRDEMDDITGEKGE